ENTMSDLAIGQNDNAMDGEDSQDFDSPPAPPGQTLHAFFKTDGRELFKDFRNSTTQSQIWNLQIRPGSGDTIMLSWNVDISYLHGSLMLKNADSSVEINMQDQSNVEIQKANADSVIIEYQLSN
ncbi:MAG TPA: hypothetical protein VJ964_00895, partial [Balneolaceae bacterium]|nr:hypothetical protein [Balneolaceae bacterium]